MARLFCKVKVNMETVSLMVERKTGPSFVSDNNLHTALVDAYGTEKASIVLKK